MMNKTSFFSSLLLLIAGTGITSAEIISPAQALARLGDDASVASQAPRRLAARVRKAAPARIIEREGAPALYLFTPADGGLLVLPADDDAMPLAGYTENFTAGDEIPPAMEYMLSHYAAEIADLRSGALPAPSAAAGAQSDMPSIAPICKTRWNQGAPYNADCPKLNGEPTMTGCLATAIAQVLKAYEYPSRCSGGTYSYQWAAGQQTLSIDFDKVTLDWASMADSYTESQSAPAVAALMRAAGYCADMGYSPVASGAYGTDLAAGLVRNFGYDCTLSYEHRSWYTLAQWQVKIYETLAAGRPVYYDGATPDMAAAHAFVVDGYASDGFFHLNWGWGGMSDGYFRLSALDPAMQGIGGSASGYDAGQGAILGMKPGATTPRGDAPLCYFANAAFSAVGSTAKLGDKVTFEGGNFNNGPLVTSGMSTAVKITASDGNERYVASDEVYKDVPVGAGLNSWEVAIPRNLADGVYIITPAVKNLTNGEFYDTKTDIGGDGYIVAEVEHGFIFFENREAGKLTCISQTVPETLYPSTPFYYSATIENKSEDVYSGSLWLNLFPEGGRQNQIIGNIGAFFVELEPGQSTVVTCPMKFIAGITPGSYDVALYDDNGKRLTVPVTIKVARRPARGVPACSAITVNDRHANKLSFTLDVSCPSGLYADALYVVVTDISNNTVDYFASRPVVMDAGESATVNITGDLTATGIVGRRYKAYPFYFDGTNIVQIPGVQPQTFILQSAESSIVEIGDSAGNAPAEYFDLQGRRVASPRGGVFIRRQGVVTEKVRL